MTGGYSHTYRVAVPVAHRGLKPEGEVVANPELKLGVSPMPELPITSYSVGWKELTSRVLPCTFSQEF